MSELCVCINGGRKKIQRTENRGFVVALLLPTLPCAEVSQLILVMVTPRPSDQMLYSIVLVPLTRLLHAAGAVIVLVLSVRGGCRAHS